MRLLFLARAERGGGGLLSGTGFGLGGLVIETRTGHDETCGMDGLINPSPPFYRSPRFGALAPTAQHAERWAQQYVCVHHRPFAPKGGKDSAGGWIGSDSVKSPPLGTDWAPIGGGGGGGAGALGLTIVQCSSWRGAWLRELCSFNRSFIALAPTQSPLSDIVHSLIFFVVLALEGGLIQLLTLMKLRTVQLALMYSVLRSSSNYSYLASRYRLATSSYPALNSRFETAPSSGNSICRFLLAINLIIPSSLTSAHLKYRPKSA